MRRGPGEATAAVGGLASLAMHAVGFGEGREDAAAEGARHGPHRGWNDHQGARQDGEPVADPIQSMRLPDLRCDYFDLTPTAGAGNGESFARVPVGKHDLILGDAGYSSAAGINWVVSQGGDVLVRINPQTLPLQRKRGHTLDLLSHVKASQTAGAIGEW